MLLGLELFLSSFTKDFTIADDFKGFIGKCATLLLVEVVISMSKEVRLSLNIVGVGALDEFILVAFNTRHVFIGVWKNLVFNFKLLFDPSEFNAPFLCSEQEELLGIWERVVQF